jgi:O-antigen/teichoic acid export membrane protein
MLLSNKRIVRGIAWTTITYVAALAFRFLSSVVLSRLLAPNIIGMMVVVSVFRTGMELLSDVGLGQNIVQNRNGRRPSFYNTAWVLQIIRGVIISSLLFAFSVEISKYYDVGSDIVKISAFALMISGFQSTSLYLLQKNIKVVQLTLFDLSMEVMTGTVAVVAALISPTIYSLIIASVVSTVIRTLCSYLLPDSRQAFVLYWRHASEILSFGKWIFLSSLLMFVSSSFDKLYLGQVAPLAMLGIYSIARTIADLPGALVLRLSYSLVFPVMASASSMPREEVRTKLSRLRCMLLFGAAFALAGAISVSDIAIRIIYDSRYQDAAWMLPLLLGGVWITIIASLAESTLLGLGRPVYAIVGSILKLIVLFGLVPFAFQRYGMLGAVLGIAIADLARLPALLFGQVRERFSFVRQDMVATLLLVVLTAVFALARRSLGFGTILDTLPLG